MEAPPHLVRLGLPMLRYAVTIFLGAFLLFQVQPMMGKVILPWFGGGASIWTTCVLFFQVGLLGGYLYAHCLTTWLRPKAQCAVHVALLAASLLLLPSPAAWKPEPGAEPIGGILLLLAANVGLPFLMLSATGPLLQAWLARTSDSLASPGRSPYRLYALSNAASLLALLSYPIAVETTLGASVQLTAWSLGYAAFALGCGYSAMRFGLSGARDVAGRGGKASNSAGECVTGFPGVAEVARLRGVAETPNSGEFGYLPEIAAPRPTHGTVLLWLGLSAAGSAMLLATTNQLCQEVAVVPFLWIVPLVLYLLSFVICFDSPRWYNRTFCLFFLAIMAALAVASLFLGVSMPLAAQLAIFPLTLLACCMTCHGELVRAKPEPRHLTLFYLMIALGGALGGALVALAAPAVFTGYWEYHVALAGCCLLTLIAWRRDGFTPVRFLSPDMAWGCLLAGQTALVAALASQAWRTHGHETTVLATRNFYGALRVRETVDDDATPEPVLQLIHGQISHGFQYREGDRLRPCSYYSPQSGVALALQLCRDERPDGLRVGVVGLGTGTIAAHGRPGDMIRFYEINPQVVRLSSPDYFTYRDASAAEVEVVLGDARISMEEELRSGRPQQYDVLAVDAFSSDAIPIHLLTKECADIYWQHLKPDGVLALHISNRFLSLGGVTRGLAACRPGCQALLIENAGDDDGADTAAWVLLTSNARILEAAEITGDEEQGVPSRVTPWTDEEPILWTDDFHALWRVVRWVL